MKNPLILIALTSVLLAGSLTASAETVAGGGCSGALVGTPVQGNPNWGEFTFNAHPGPVGEEDGYNEATDLNVVGVGQDGLAPGAMADAACITDDDLALRGYAWLTNAGFVSFYCDGAGGTCGNYAYGVEVSVKDGNGRRDFSGEAWNSSVGYIYFDDVTLPGGQNVAIDVYADKNGKVHGYAFSDAGLWLNMTGLTAYFSDVDPNAGLDENGQCINYCDCPGQPQPYICFEVSQCADDPTTCEADGVNVVPTGDVQPGKVDSGLKMDGSGEDGVPDIQAALDTFDGMVLADGEEGYVIHLYLKEEDGVTPMNLDDYVFGNITFNWEDTVKRTQLAGVEAGDWDEDPEPWLSGGGVVYKPVNVEFPEDFEEVEPGHWILKNTLRAYAPTTNGNLSWTTGLNPNTQFQNEFFFTDLVDEDDEIWTVPGNIERNDLILNSVDFTFTNADGTDVIYEETVYPGVAFVEGKIKKHFNFLPAAYLKQLYSDGQQDGIEGFRGIPFNLTMQAEQVGNLGVDAGVTVKLDYEAKKTESYNFCGPGANFEVVFSDLPEDVVVCDPQEEEEEGEEGEENEDVPKTGSCLDVSVAEFAAPQVFTAIANLVIEGGQDAPDEDAFCSKIAGPSVYSIVDYVVGGKLVQYYSNKLPRLATVIGNPDVVVHGNIYSNAFTPTHETQSQGDTGMDLFRNAVDENLKRELAKADQPRSGGQCVITRMLNEQNSKVKCTGGSRESYLKVGQEHVLYFKGTDVTFDLEPGRWQNKWVVVVEGGRIFVDDDVYAGEISDDRKLAVVGLRPFGEECSDNNFYIHANVRNVQMNLATDCTVLSYADRDSIMEEGPYPGEVEWGSAAARLAALDNQLLWEGSVVSRNTIGLSDGEKYAQDGYGEVFEFPLTEEERLHVQAHDWNFMRLGLGKMEYSDDGLPIDQSCYRALTVEDMVKIKNGETLYGEKVIEDPFFGDIQVACDGIDPTTLYDETELFSGDLLPKTEGVAEKLDPSVEFNPVYIYYVPPASDSFVFKKSGGVGR